MASLALCARPALGLARLAASPFAPRRPLHSLFRLLPNRRRAPPLPGSPPRCASVTCAHRPASWRPICSDSAAAAGSRGAAGTRGQRKDGALVPERKGRGPWRARAAPVSLTVEELTVEKLTAERLSVEERTGSIAVERDSREEQRETGETSFRGGVVERGDSGVRGNNVLVDSERKSSGSAKSAAGMPKRKRGYSAEEEGKRLLNLCSKHGDLRLALALFDRHVAGTGLSFSAAQYNIALYLCALVAATGEVGAVPPAQTQAATAAGALAADGAGGGEQWSAEEARRVAAERGREVYEDMQRRGVAPNEASFTALARLASATGDAPLAFRVVADMAARGIPPRHRSYDPALLAFCRQGNLPKAEEVFQHMAARGLAALPEQVAALLDVSVRAGSPGSVYKNIHRLRKVTRGLPPNVIESLRAWFGSDAATGGGEESEGGMRDEGAVEVAGSNAGEGEENGKAGEAGRRVWSREEAERAMAVNGGGWHGLGWAPHSSSDSSSDPQDGHWEVADVRVSEDGQCSGCGAHLATIDLDEGETARFAAAVDALVEARGKGRELAAFKAWLQRHGPFAAVVDAANVGLYNQNFKDGGFSFWQLHSIAKAVAALAAAAPHSPSPAVAAVAPTAVISPAHTTEEAASPSPVPPQSAPATSHSPSSSPSRAPSPRLPLLVLHHKRVKGPAASQPFAQQCLAQYEQQHCLYATPTGANDDWYWMYAAISMRCLLVTNDEMRDHIFQTLGADYFSRWKERHQVRFTMTPRGPQLRMPPNFSFVIQECSSGGWHFPKAQHTGEQGAQRGEQGEGEVEMQGERGERTQEERGDEENTKRGEGGGGEGGVGMFDEWLCVQWKKK